MKRITLLTIAAAVALASVSAAAQANHHAKITAQQARKAALAKYPGKVVGKVGLENEDGKWQFSVMVRSGKTLREVMVDANTGKVASVEVTSAAQEAKEAEQEAAAKKKKG